MFRTVHEFLNSPFQLLFIASDLTGSTLQYESLAPFVKHKPIFWHIDEQFETTGSFGT